MPRVGRSSRVGHVSRLGQVTQDLGDRMADVVILTMSEFGRTARQNGSGGTDHGHAGCLFVIGGGVKGGKVHGRWPGLAPEQLNEGRDLALTTDFRSVFGEVVKIPDSEPMQTQPSRVIVQRPGRRPLRSSIAPRVWPSQNARPAGPSQGSTRRPWYR